MSGYIGNIPTPQATQTRDTFTATAGQTTFATSGYTPSFLDVFMNGVHLLGGGVDYTATNGSDVVLTSGAAAGDTLEVVAFSTFEASDVTASSGFTVTGNLSVDGGTIKLDGAYPVGSNNVALGSDAFANNVSGAQNTALGERALNASTTTSWNTAVGYKSSFSNTSGTNLTSVGSESLILNTTGSNNTALGTNSLYFNTSGSSNTGVGTSALQSNTTASNNTAVGYRAGYSNTTGLNNVCVGFEALYNNTTGQLNTSVGLQALASSTTGNENTAVGQRALVASTTGYQNTAVGRNALSAATTGYSNTAIGQGAGRDITTGTRNTIVGRYSGNQGGLDIRTSSNNIVLSDGDGNPRLRITSSNDLITGASTATAGFTVWNTSGGLEEYRATSNGGFGITHFYSDVGGTRAFKAYIDANGNFNTSSDYRIKENVTDVTGAIDRIKSLRPVSYNQIGSDQHQEGFIAHEVQQVIPHIVSGEKDQVKSDGSIFVQTVNYSGLIATLTAALKESITRIEQLEAEVATLKGS